MVFPNCRSWIFRQYNFELVQLRGLEHWFSTGTILRPPPPRAIWQCLETSLVVTTGWGGATGTWWVEARGPANQPAVHKTAFPAKTSWS